MHADRQQLHVVPDSAVPTGDLLRRARVVIVDDHLTNTALLRRMMQTVGITHLHGVTDPRKTVQVCRDVGADLVLLDWHMPGMDGSQVLSALRSAANPGEFLPVIVLTADASKSVRNKALAAGANDFLTKPLDLSEVTLRVRNLLQTRALHEQLQRHNIVLQADLDRHAETQRTQAFARTEQERRIRSILDGAPIPMAFQPIANLQTGQVVGYEALARFRAEPTRPPNEWFAEAQCVGLLAQLEIAAMRSALSQLAAFRPSAFLSINVSPGTATTPEFAALVAQFAGHRMVLELTEHSPIEDYSALVPALDALRDRGVRVAVDDTGAGYSSLRHVLRLRPDVLKLDIALTQGIDGDPARRALATALVAFSHEIGATIVAEGIETAAELQTLARLGVALGQGYLLGRPAPASEARTTVEGSGDDG